MTTQNESNETVDIRPGVSVLSVLRHLNYQAWFALAEFVDNALQSYLQNREALIALSPRNSVLHISIVVDADSGGMITIRDDAAGIHPQDFPRAFRTAEVPPDRSGLSEFGMGMKSAACWFATKWSVRTSALGDPYERQIHFDIKHIVQDSIEELIVRKKDSVENTHFTEVRLESLHTTPQGRTISKIKEHLASIYRFFIRDGLLELKYNGEILTYKNPKILSAPHYRTLNLESIDWYKKIDFDFGMGQRVTGFAAILEKGSTSGAGFALFRRNRLIQGSGEDTYRPAAIFGGQNSFRRQRIFGELDLEGFEVSHTKDGFQWAELEDEFLELLGEELDNPPISLLLQAEGYRAKTRPAEWLRSAETAIQHTAEVIERDVPPVLEEQFEAVIQNEPPPQELPSIVMTSERKIEVELQGKKWIIHLELSHDPAVGDWLSISDKTAGFGVNDKRVIAVRIALAHPFMERFAGPDRVTLEPIIRLAAGLGLAEIAAREAGASMSGTIRRFLNQLLSEALSKD
jgi:Histidine kinase-, DNA gyrase B-, and HSP90-like ATPase